MYHLTHNSTNQKVGLGVAVSTSSASTCPDACPLKAKGCYASSGPVAIHWRKVTKAERGTVWKAFLSSVASLPVGYKFRHNQAGDLPGQNNKVSASMLRQLTAAIASRALQAWTYTHKPLTRGNLAAIREANDAGFAINLSADNLAEADRKAATGLPTVVILPRNAPATVFTPEGRKVVTCPAQTRPGATCASCMLCAKVSRSVIIGFRAHGTTARAAETIANS
jgi:hypothetical protein